MSKLRSLESGRYFLLEILMSIFFPVTSQGDKSHKTKSLRNHMKEFVNVSIWMKKRYVVWAVSIPLALFG